MTTRLSLDTDDQSYRYYRHAVENHWDPAEIDLSADREAIGDLDDGSFEALKETLALFGAGEEAVTEDLAPLGAVLDGTEDQLFITTQLYEEAKHTDFFERYWREIVNGEEETRSQDRSSPTEDRWFNDPYLELFERNEAAMARLLDADTPENRAKAYSHYHLTVEGILAQTGYFGLTRAYGEKNEELPHLPGLVEGLTRIRGDEGRHVGFGMAQLKALIETGEIEAELVEGTVSELVPLVQGAIPQYDSDSAGPESGELIEYATEKHGQRMGQITNAAAEIPDIEKLTALEG